MGLKCREDQVHPKKAEKTSNNPLIGLNAHLTLLKEPRPADSSLKGEGELAVNEPQNGKEVSLVLVLSLPSSYTLKWSALCYFGMLLCKK